MQGVFADKNLMSRRGSSKQRWLTWVSIDLLARFLSSNTMLALLLRAIIQVQKFVPFRLSVFLSRRTDRNVGLVKAERGNRALFWHYT